MFDGDVNSKQTSSRGNTKSFQLKMFDFGSQNIIIRKREWEYIKGSRRNE